MKPQEILEALSQLDPQDNDHWTADGQPRTGAVGEKVTRAEIQAVAPLFNRKNAELPQTEPDLTEQEVKQTLEEELLEVQARTNAAREAIKAAIQAKADAEKAFQDAQDSLEKIRADEKAKDTRTDTEINMDYLRSEFNQRLARATRRQHIHTLLEMADLSTNDIQILTSSPIDRAIAEQVIKARKQRSKAR
jgi:hypothetical protein